MQALRLKLMSCHWHLQSNFTVCSSHSGLASCMNCSCSLHPLMEAGFVIEIKHARRFSQLFVSRLLEDVEDVD